MPPRVGIAGWSIRAEQGGYFPGEGTHLQRYALRFRGVEINSSFYRPHRRATYIRWANSTPPDFRFSVKLPRQITHENRLAGDRALVETFLEQASGLGNKLGVLLVQLPPSLSFDASATENFFVHLREHADAPIACEPRHASWFTEEADALLRDHGICRVAADPAILPIAKVPGGDRRLAYFRWHGSPRMYYSAYDRNALRQLAELISNEAEIGREVWFIFDNTAEGAATDNARALLEHLLEIAITNTSTLSEPAVP
jgi:uncharacterized protein YecE (DUF72 family)